MQKVRSMVESFSEIVDPRMDRTKRHLLEDIICLAVLAVIAGAEGWEDIEEFGRDKHVWLKKHLRLPHGIPSHDTISRVFRLLKPAEFEAAFHGWIESLHEELGTRLVAIDGKTLRRSYDRRTMKSALHLVSAWSVANHVVLGHQSVEGKSNEITAIPKLLEMLELKGAIVSIDAMGCQKEIAKAIVKGGGDYVLAVKDNQPSLHAAIDQHFKDVLENGSAKPCRQHTTREPSRDRHEERHYAISELPKELAHFQKEWPGLRSIGEVVSITRRNGEETCEVRHFILSCDAKVKQFAASVRGHWGIENSLHWVLDVTFQEDQSRIRQGNGPNNFSLLRRFALSLIKQDKSPGSVKRKRKRAGWNNEALETIAQLTA
jgi:predicted transposase YbfD/YdcC